MIDNPEHERQSQALPQKLIRIPDPDAPVYRIFPLWYLEETLRLRQLVLVQPDKWEDPFEMVVRQIAVDRWENGRVNQVIINQTLPLAFAQCWSATAESDTLLRAYSRVVKDSHFKRNTCPRDEGVRVRSTPRKLLQALATGAANHPAGNCYMGAVQYKTEAALLQEITNMIGLLGDDAYHEVGRHAHLLLMKRDAFAHEAELRLLYVQDQLDPSQPLLRVSIDPNEIFDEVTFDPRLEEFERKEREAVFRSLGYMGLIGLSGLYQRVFLQIALGQPRPSA